MAIVPRRIASMFDDFFEPRMWSMMGPSKWGGDLAESTMASWKPTCDVCENDKSYTIRAELPGAKKEDVKVDLDGNRLTISGCVNQEKTTENERFHSQERAYGSFMRTFTMPQNAKLDSINAKYENGVLDLCIPKASVDVPKARAIKIA